MYVGCCEVLRGQSSGLKCWLLLLGSLNARSYAADSMSLFAFCNSVCREADRTRNSIHLIRQPLTRHAGGTRLEVKLRAQSNSGHEALASARTNEAGRQQQPLARTELKRRLHH